MDIVVIRTFLAAASTGSFAGAAQRVNASASSVTDRIQSLEHQLRARLFERSKKGCTLTAAGRRFMEPAQAIVSGWETGQQEVALPSRFTASMNVGGQFALWPCLLVPWLAAVRCDHPNLAVRAVAASPTRLNRELFEGTLDLIFLYDPVFRKEVMTEMLFDDRLVMVTANSEVEWEQNFVRVHWSSSIDAEITSRLGIHSRAGLVLDLGIQAVTWIVQQKASGYLPEKLIQSELAQGILHMVADAPPIHHPAYVCWRRDIDSTLGAELILAARDQLARG